MKDPVGFIGLGNMGSGMAKNLLKAGFPLVVHDLRKEPLAEAEKQGARIARSPKEVARQARTTILVLLNFPQIEEVLGGEEGLEQGLKAGDALVVMSTVSPGQIRDLGNSLGRRGVRVLDAPISGGKEGAEAGTLSIMVGGDKEEFERCLPLFRAMGKNVYHLGGPGCGMSLKLVNNLLVAVNNLAVAEALVLGRKAGLDPAAILEVIPRSAGDSWIFRNRAPQMVGEDFTCRGELDILVKDLNYVLEMGRAVGAPLLLSAVAREVYQAASGLGWGKEDDSAVVKVIEKMAGWEPEKGRG